MNSEITFKKFDIKRIKLTNSCNVIGVRSTGKTVLLKDIIYYQNITDGIVITDDERSEYEYPKYSPELVDNLIDSLKKRMSENLQNSNMVVIYKPILKIDIKMKELFLNNRHYKIMFLIDSQLPLRSVHRANIDFSFIFKTSNLKTLYKNHFSFTTYGIFEQIYNTLGFYECLVIDNTTNSDKIEDIIFFYKANLHVEQVLLR